MFVGAGRVAGLDLCICFPLRCQSRSVRTACLVEKVVFIVHRVARVSRPQILAEFVGMVFWFVVCEVVLVVGRFDFSAEPVLEFVEFDALFDMRLFVAKERWFDQRRRAHLDLIGLVDGILVE